MLSAVVGASLAACGGGNDGPDTDTTADLDTGIDLRQTDVEEGITSDVLRDFSSDPIEDTGVDADAEPAEDARVK